ncbi:uncharacterized protein LOC125239389 [Leguminivora glycinivorella]|uniref:uncharacterized protein LOC125239389 n=1 Tax=Leguminivora glycinivorella TaxID=1035111 RepID=UPI00200D0683|nr:uncharacterized protein LOC125239389 [Leguminivora glycinivorella]
MTLLDKIPDSTWFFCFPMSLAVFCITCLGIIHPFLWIKVMKVYRSELFVFMYVLIVFWAVLSVALMYAIYAESHCIYSFWIWYTLVFGLLMAGLMFLLFCGFCVLAMRRKSVVALIGCVYYLVTVYFVVVVNKQRKEVFGLAATCHSCAIKHVFPNPDASKQHMMTTIMQTIQPPPLVTDNFSRKSRTPSPVTTPIPSTTQYYGTRYVQLAENHSWTSPYLLDYTQPKYVQLASEHNVYELSLPDHRPSPNIHNVYDDRRRRPPTAAFTNMVRNSMPMAAFRAHGGGDDRGEHWQPTAQQLQQTAEQWHHTTANRMWTHGRTYDAQTMPHTTLSDRVEAIARLSELLINSNECRKPRKPAHGRFQASGRRSAHLKLTLHCDPGYRESSVATECKFNWWDRPIPQCRKRKEPGPLPHPGGGCILPGYPAHGEYRVADHARARPGDLVTGDNVVLLVTCDEPYRAVDPYVICVEGRWRHGPPTCLKHCKLVFDPTVEYRCFKAFKDEFLACSTWQPDGTVVTAACRPGHAHRGPFRYMRCRGDTWDHAVSCLPNSNFTEQL